MKFCEIWKKNIKKWGKMLQGNLSHIEGKISQVKLS